MLMCCYQMTRIAIDGVDVSSPLCTSNMFSIGNTYFPAKFNGCWTASPAKGSKNGQVLWEVHFLRLTATPPWWIIKMEIHYTQIFRERCDVCIICVPSLAGGFKYVCLFSPLLGPNDSQWRRYNIVSKMGGLTKPPPIFADHCPS